jgi:hypothetical protein
MAGKTLPGNASLGQLRAHAKELRRAYESGNPSALARVRGVRLHAAPGAELPLREAQFVIARVRIRRLARARRGRGQSAEQRT